MRSGTLVLLAAWLATGGWGAGRALAGDPVADDEAIVRSGRARFTVLTPRMIRMEWSPDGVFEDRASLVFGNRRLPPAGFFSVESDGWLDIGTERFTLRYRVGSGPFTAENLSIRFRTPDGESVWRPGRRDEGNLGGTLRTLDEVFGGVSLSPGVLSREGWTWIDDSRTPVLGAAEGGKATWIAPRDGTGAIDAYFLAYGRDYRAALGDFVATAGRIPLPPRYALGIWWSRYWAYTDEELRRLVGEFRARDVPLDVLVVDMDWHLPGWTGYTWNPECFPDPEGFLDWAHGEGLRVALNLHPAGGVARHEAAFPAVARRLGLDPETTDRVAFDCTDPRFAEAYLVDLHRPLERQGVDFWWIDWQQGSRLPGARIPGIDPLFWLNHLHWTDAEADPERRDRRPLLLSRWGGLGGHRYPLAFSGDTYSAWESLAFQPFFTATAGNVGCAWWSHDIGGHQPGPVDPELYVRWVQWGALSPVLRTHTTKDPGGERRIWEFPDEAFRAMREAFRLRRELVPYLYGAARQTHDDGIPLCRPLYLEWPGEDEAYRRPGTYLLGDSLLVHPVTSPADPATGLARVDLWFPPGAWIDRFTGRAWRGPAEHSILVPMQEIPLFVRAGAILALQDPSMRAGGPPSERRILEVWPGGSGEARLYDDDGCSPGYLRGECTWTPVRHVVEGGTRRLTIGPEEGSYPGMPGERVDEVRFRDVPPPASVSVGGKALEAMPPGGEGAGWHYDEDLFLLTVRLPRRKSTAKAEIVVSPRAPFEPAAVDPTEGLRGAIRAVAGTTEGLAPSGEAVTRPGRTGGALEAHVADRLRRIREARLGADEARRRIARLLGIGVTVHVTAAERGARRAAVEAEIVVTPPVGRTPRLSGSLVASADPPWEAVSQPRRFRADRPGRPARVSTVVTAAADGPPSPGRVRGSVTLETEGGRIEFPFERTLLPSIGSWRVLGPVPAGEGEGEGEAVGVPGGLALDASFEGSEGRVVSWRRVERPLDAGSDLTSEFVLDFREMFDVPPLAGHFAHSPHDGGDDLAPVAWSVTWLHAARETDAVLVIRADGEASAWIDGRPVGRIEHARLHPSREGRFALRLRPGANELRIAVVRQVDPWRLVARVEAPAGGPARGVRVAASRTDEGEGARGIR
jgi:alpha-glucosidase